MGKAKKQLTNQRRAQRLGTGEGITRTSNKSGGVPAWAYLVSGSVLLAAVIVTSGNELREYRCREQRRTHGRL